MIHATRAEQLEKSMEDKKEGDEFGVEEREACQGN